MEQLDLDKNGSLSSKEYKYLEQYFMYDNNKDGVLDKVELGMYLVSLDRSHLPLFNIKFLASIPSGKVICIILKFGAAGQIWVSVV